MKAWVKLIKNRVNIMGYTEMMTSLARKLSSEHYNKAKLAIDVLLRDVTMAVIGYVTYTQIIDATTPAGEQPSLGIGIGASIAGTNIPAIYNLLIHPWIESYIIKKFLGDETLPLNTTSHKEPEKPDRCQSFVGFVKNFITRDLLVLATSFGFAGLPIKFGAPKWVSDVFMTHSAAFFSTAINRRDTEQGVTPTMTKRM